MQQLNPKAVWLFFISSVTRWIIPLLFLGVFLGGLAATESTTEGFSIPLWFKIIFPLVVLILLYVWARLSYHFYRYELSSNGLRTERGVIYKKYVTIPYERIQNVDIHRGILARILGLSDLQIQTAGVSASVSRYGAMGIHAEGRLPGLDHQIAEQMRDDLINRARGAHSPGL